MAFEFKNPVTEDELTSYLRYMDEIVQAVNYLTGKNAGSIVSGLLDINSGFESVIGAVAEKGGDMSAVQSLSDLPDAIRSIPAGGAEWSHIEDGATRLYIDLQDGYTSPMMGLQVYGTASIDWGDGTTPTEMTGTSFWNNTLWTEPHQYPSAGKYTITISGGSFAFAYNSTSAWNASTALRSSEQDHADNQMYMSAIIGVDIGSNMARLGNGSFFHCKGLKRVYVPESINWIGHMAFAHCYALQDLRLPETIQTVNANGFYMCNLREFAFPSGIASVPQYFCGSNKALQKITIPEDVTSIGEWAFGGAEALRELTIPKNVAAIASRAFTGLNTCTKLTFLAQTPPVLAAADAFSALPTRCVIHVPKGKLNAYKSATNYPSAATYTYVEDTV